VKARREKHAQVRETRPRLVPQRKTRLTGIENRLRDQHIQRLRAGDPGLRRACIRQRRHREARQPFAQERGAAFQQLGIGIDEKEDHRDGGGGAQARTGHRARPHEWSERLPKQVSPRK
ncbi:MAG: hypothetical protein ACK56I_22335, partial [bacterium]